MDTTTRDLLAELDAAKRERDETLRHLGSANNECHELREQLLRTRRDRDKLRDQLLQLQPVVVLLQADASRNETRLRFMEGVIRDGAL